MHRYDTREEGGAAILHRALPRQQPLAAARGGGGRGGGDDRPHGGDERGPVGPGRDGRRHPRLLAAQLGGRRGGEREALGLLRVRGGRTTTDQQRRRRAGLGQVAHRRAARREALVRALPAASAALPGKHLRGGGGEGGGGGVGAAPVRTDTSCNIFTNDKWQDEGKFYKAKLIKVLVTIGLIILQLKSHLSWIDVRTL